MVKYLYLLFFNLKLSILCSSGVIPCALLTSMSHGSQYVTLLPAFHPSTSSFSSKTEHWLQIGILYFKHSYFVFIKHEQHISILLELKCDVFNAFLNLALSGRDIVFALRMLVRGGNSVWQMGEYVFLWHFPSLSHLNKLFCNLHDL